MPTTLLIVYRVLGTVLFALAAAAIVEKYRTVRGAVLLPASARPTMPCLPS